MNMMKLLLFGIVGTVSTCSGFSVGPSLTSSSLYIKSGLFSSFTGDKFGTADDGADYYRRIMAKARGYAYFNNNDIGAPSPQDAQQLLEEMFSMESWCADGSAAGALVVNDADICENVDEMAGIVARLRELAAFSVEEKKAVMMNTVTTALSTFFILFIVVASFVAAPPEAIDASTAATVANDLEDFQAVAVDGFIWTI